MSRDDIPKMEDVLKRDRAEYNDCLSCRLLGCAGVFMGMGAFTFISGHHNLRKQRTTIIKSGSMLGYRGRATAITAMSMGLFGLGLYRTVN
ncbi:hypothetical protein EJ08DRAFT_579758 [Tothia fuscella]|uniref:Distal membrane-arm assembly complex protein 1-like domain-containing protein n=1 Tax=Tothia fuscella TaxID=1048955 RepID=A0A9P4P1L6_9PEZI|nr:hypothetical protein EJ08DRAFT_579758 [Tothia fuscella]